MVLSAAVPQDIIETILSKLSRRKVTLKQCSLVSRAFLPTCQKWLFYTARLTDPLRCWRLHRLIGTNPTLASYIRRLGIYSYVPPDDPSLDSDLDDESDHWIVKEESLSPLLQMLHSLCFFSLRAASPCNTGRQPNWSDFPADLQSSLFHLLQTPSVTDITLEGIQVFPVGLLSSLLRLKRLRLCNVSITSCPIWVPPAYASSSGEVKGYLESLYITTPMDDLHFSTMPTTVFCPPSVLRGHQLVDALEHPDSLLGISGLRKLISDVCTDDVFEMIKAAAHSLLFLAWNMCGSNMETECMFKSVLLRWLNLTSSQQFS
jgi:hypothetical protein